MTADEIVVWLTAQLDVDERLAQAADPGPWRVGVLSGSFHRNGEPAYPGDEVTIEGNGEVWPQPGEIRGNHIYSQPSSGTGRMIADMARGYMRSRHEANAEHIARHDPARALRQVAAMRSRLERHTPATDGAAVLLNIPDMPDYCRHCGHTWPCPDLRDDMAVFADRPGYPLEQEETLGG